MIPSEGVRQITFGQLTSLWSMLTLFYSIVATATFTTIEEVCYPSTITVKSVPDLFIEC